MKHGKLELGEKLHNFLLFNHIILQGKYHNAGCILIAQKRAKGIYNISGKDYYSILELAHVVADYYKLDKNLIKPSKSADIKQPAKRPPITGFIIDKAKNDLGYNPHSFTEGIKILEDQIKAMGK